MSLNYRQFGMPGYHNPDPSVVTKRRKNLTDKDQSNKYVNTPDSELWTMRKNRSLSDDVERELKARNLL